MRVAILVSGYLRSFKSNLPKTIEVFEKNFNDIDIFFHITEDEKVQDKYLNFIDYQNDIPFIIESFNPKSVLIEKNKCFSKHQQKNSLYNTWYKFYKLNKIKKLEEEISGNKYDIVIKLRPDIEILEENFKHIFDENYISIPKKSLIDKTKLTKVDDRYICDTMAFGTSEMMDKYFEIFNHLNYLTDEFGYVSETLLIEYLEKQKIKFNTIEFDYNVILSECNVFAICGDSGSGKSTLSEILKNYFNKSFVLECDRYHKWDRNNDNWKKYTHLNPESNYITKMNEDIFNLKLGKEIFQVDYDHKTGEFTDKEYISSSNNLIVCGLHSLYNENNHVYNLKIFIDTDDRLKREWKINRDVKLRNKDLDEVLEQIHSRKGDFEKFILPQKLKSDIIINFYPTKDNLEDVGLKLMVKKEINISDLVLDMKKSNLQFNIDEDELFYIFDFEKFIPIDLGIYPPQNNFYDYIIYFIFNLKK